MAQILSLVAAGVLLSWGVLIFNRLVKDRNRASSAWSDIDVQLQRRHDLIPRLVEAVRAYAGYERATLEAVTELRARSKHSERISEIAELEQQIEAGMHRLLALAEDYPDLKANENFLRLQDELMETEDHLQYARRFYNGAVRLFNTRIQSFPDLLVARSFGFAEAEFFDAEADAAAPVHVKLRNPPEKTPELFEAYLPYALALSVEQPWAEKFAAVFERLQSDTGRGYQPTWYRGRWDSRGFGRSVSSLTDMTDSLGSAISSSATQPGSSSGAGGGGFSGGGGGGW